MADLEAEAKEILGRRLIALGKKRVADMSEGECWLATCGICQSAELERIKQELERSGYLQGKGE